MTLICAACHNESDALFGSRGFTYDGKTSAGVEDLCFKCWEAREIAREWLEDEARRREGARNRVRDNIREWFEGDSKLREYFKEIGVAGRIGVVLTWLGNITSMLSLWGLASFGEWSWVKLVPSLAIWLICRAIAFILSPPLPPPPSERLDLNPLLGTVIGSLVNDIVGWIVFAIALGGIVMFFEHRNCFPSHHSPGWSAVPNCEDIGMTKSIIAWVLAQVAATIAIAALHIAIVWMNEQAAWRRTIADVEAGLAGTPKGRKRQKE